MPVVKRKNMAYVPEAVRISEIVGGSLGEETVYLVPGRGTDYELLFDDNRAWFRLDHVIPCEDGSLCFAIELVEQGGGVWESAFDGVTLEHFAAIMEEFARGGFPGDGTGILCSGFLWSSTRGRPGSVETEDSCPGEAWDSACLPDDGEEGWGDGSELDAAPAGCRAGLRSGWEAVQPSIVPDGITQLRVVALKYRDSVVAYRFKTNAGAFDMCREAALRYGLGGSRTETYITLQNVNGVLMSGAERERRACVPDVSGCEEDCEKLMRALFDA